jgi:hypothetical protein
VWDQATWRYELLGKSPQNVNRAELRVIEGLAGVHAGERVGYLAHPFNTWGPMMVVTAYELLPGVSWAEVTPAVIRYLQAVGEDYVSENEVNEPFEGFGFWLGREHPVYQTIPERLPRLRKPYAWFLRLPDLPAFLRRIAPVLESRLSASPLVGHTGEIKISFYRSGFRLAFEAGKLAEVNDWKPAPQGHSGDASFPDLTFLQLLFGYRSLEELQYAFADCIVNGDQAIALLNSLFPKQASSVWPIS